MAHLRGFSLLPGAFSIDYKQATFLLVHRLLTFPSCFFRTHPHATAVPEANDSFGTPKQRTFFVLGSSLRLRHSFAWPGNRKCWCSAPFYSTSTRKKCNSRANMRQRKLFEPSGTYFERRCSRSNSSSSRGRQCNGLAGTSKSHRQNIR
jgi:hypothetical protein